MWVCESAQGDKAGEECSNDVTTYGATSRTWTAS